MVVRLARLAPPLECVRLYDLEAGLDGFIAIHSTALGPGGAGCGPIPIRATRLPTLCASPKA